MHKARIAAAVFAVGCSLLASLNASAAQLEEIIVTAQHRAQSLQDVPVSVSAMGGEKMQEAGINRLEDLQAYIPNLTISPSGLSTDIFIRGIGSGMNQGFEQSVGMYVDGIYYGRAQLAQAPFLDLERVEILRGPQNILQGKNSIAGAISIVTAQPSEEFEAFLSGSYESGVGEKVSDLMVSGPIGDRFGIRLAARLREYEGHIENLTLDRMEPYQDEATYRLKVDWDVSDDALLSFKIEVGNFDRVGATAEVIRDLPSDSDTFIFTGRTEAEILDRTQFPEVDAIGNIIPPLSGPLNTLADFAVNVDSHDSVANNYLDYKRSSNGDFSKNDTFNATLRYDWSIPSGHEFNVIVGFIDYDYEDLCDCDSTAAPLFKLTLGEDYKQYSAEFRWLSPAEGKFEHIGGVYAQRTDLLFFDELIQDSPTVVQLLNAGDIIDGGARGDIDPNPLAPATEPEEIVGIGDAGNAVANIKAPRDFISQSDILSAFLQTTWTMTDTLRLTLGGRLTYEKKTGYRRLRLTDLQGNDLPISETDTVAAIGFAAERHELEGEREETQFSPLINLQWDASDEAMVYATLTRGFKAGGFDARSNASPSAEPTPRNPNAAVANQTVLIGTFEYDEEIATSFEVGSKMSLLDGAAELNIAAFYTLYEDLQISIFDGTVGFNVGNAQEAVTKGIELDGRWQPTEWLHLGGAIALLDFEFTDFKNGQCRQGQAPDPDSEMGLFCDYTGDTNQYVADWSGTLLAGVTLPITDDIGFGAQLDVIFTDDYNPSSNVDPDVEQPGFVKLNGRIGIGDIDRQWELALVGKNLTDETIVHYVADTPLAKTIFGTTTHTGFIAPPRTIGLQFAYRWQ